MVGLELVPQTTPLWVTTPPPAAVTFPPDMAVEVVMAETVFVVTVGKETTAVAFLFPKFG